MRSREKVLIVLGVLLVVFGVFFFVDPVVGTPRVDIRPDSGCGSMGCASCMGQESASYWLLGVGYHQWTHCSIP